MVLARLRASAYNPQQFSHTSLGYSLVWGRALGHINTAGCPFDIEKSRPNKKSVDLCPLLLASTSGYTTFGGDRGARGTTPAVILVFALVEVKVRRSRADRLVHAHACPCTLRTCHDFRGEKELAGRPLYTREIVPLLPTCVLINCVYCARASSR
jgi:hypothetical protein